MKMGLRSAQVVRAIEYLSNAERCENYQFQFRHVKRLKSHTGLTKTSPDAEKNEKKE